MKAATAVSDEHHTPGTSHQPFRCFQTCISTYVNTFLVCTEHEPMSRRESSHQMRPVQNSLQDGTEQALLAACQSSGQTKPMSDPLHTSSVLPRDSPTTSRQGERRTRQSGADGATNRCRISRELFYCPITLVSDATIRQSFSFCCSCKLWLQLEHICSSRWHDVQHVLCSCIALSHCDKSAWQSVTHSHAL